MPRRWKLRPIIRPGAPSFANLAMGGGLPRPAVPWAIGFFLLILAGCVGAVVASEHDQFGLGMVSMFGPIVLGLLAVYSQRNNVVSAPGWRYQGIALNDSVLELLEDIQGRFDYAGRNVAQVPTGIDWRDVAPHVQTLMWESAQHGARVTVLDAEAHELRYAQAGTPQAALKAKIEARRAEHWHALVDVQREAESLARVAGNAAAAARVALARTGSLRALEVVAPSTAEIVAKSALEEARVRLSMLADAWAELDDSGDALAEKLGLNRPDEPKPR